MRLLYVTDYGLCEYNGKYLCSGSHVHHIRRMEPFFEQIIFVGRANPYNPTFFPLEEKHEVFLIEKKLSSVPRMSRLIQSLLGQCDLSIGFGFNGYLMCRTAEKMKKKHILYLGTCIYDSLMSIGGMKQRLAAPIASRYVKNRAWKADYVHYVDRYLQDRYPTDGKILICPSASVYPMESAMLKRKEKILEQKENTVCKFGVIGATYNHIKGIDTAIAALRELGNGFRLEIVGGGDHRWLENLAERYDVKENVVFLGMKKNGDEIFQWLDEIDIYIQPSLTEGMPRATIEAMSRGCPVVATNVGGLASLIDKEWQILPRDIAQLSQKIHRLWNNKKLLLRQAQHNFEVSKEFDENKLNRKRNQFYEEIIAEIHGTI